MPRAAPKPCTKAGCAALAETGSRCAAHPAPKRWQDETAAKLYDRRRGTAASRGYDSRWKRIRDRHIASEPLCRWCTAFGLVTVATEVDHIVPIREGGSHDEGNLQALCHPCHSSKSQRDAKRQAACQGGAHGLREGSRGGRARSS